MRKTDRNQPRGWLVTYMGNKDAKLLHGLGYLVIDSMDCGNVRGGRRFSRMDRGDRLGGQWVTKRADLELIRREGEHIVGMGRMTMDRCYRRRLTD